MPKVALAVVIRPNPELNREDITASILYGIEGVVSLSESYERVAITLDAETEDPEALADVISDVDGVELALVWD